MAESWRRWTDIKLWRLVSGLLCAPIPVLCVGLIPLDGKLSLSSFAATIALWFWAVESAYLGMASLRNVIGRTGCAVFGGVAGITWPFFILAMMATLPQSVLENFNLRPLHGSIWQFVRDKWLGFDVLLAFCLTCVCGIFTGWVFWQFAVRPAPHPIDIDEVFS